MKKLLAVGVIVLFLGLAIAPSINADVKQIFMPTTSGNTLYVGGNGTGNYTRIQDAIDNASDGDTVFVYNGTYIENIIIKKSISLVGENRDTTIIDGSGYYHNYAIRLLGVQLVKIRGFTIRNAEEWGILISSSPSSHSNTIIGNNILNNVQGIDLTRNNTVMGNNISNNWRGIDLHGYSRNTITGNNISNNWRGISVHNSLSNTITGNNISNNKNHGICLDGSNRNTITGNTFLNNSEGIYSLLSKSNTITGNTFLNNHDGIVLWVSSNTTISGNTISKNVGNGLFLEFSSDNTIKYNNFIKNHRQASFVYGSLLQSFSTCWDSNYWNINKPRVKLIIGWNTIFIAIGIYLPYPWVNFDWHPAKEPYDI